MKHNLCSNAFLIGGLFLIPFIGGGRVNANRQELLLTLLLEYRQRLCSRKTCVHLRFMFPETVSSKVMTSSLSAECPSRRV